MKTHYLSGLESLETLGDSLPYPGTAVIEEDYRGYTIRRVDYRYLISLDGDGVLWAVSVAHARSIIDSLIG